MAEWGDTDAMSLYEQPSWAVVKEVSGSFDNMEEKVLIYLNKKREQLQAEGLETLHSDNEYEQKHIQYAKDILKTVEVFRERIKDPEDEASRKEMMAQADRASLEEMRRAKEAAQKIHDANIAQQNGPLQL